MTHIETIRDHLLMLDRHCPVFFLAWPPSHTHVNLSTRDLPLGIRDTKTTCRGRVSAAARHTYTQLLRVKQRTPQYVGSIRHAHERLRAQYEKQLFINILIEAVGWLKIGLRISTGIHPLSALSSCLQQTSRLTASDSLLPDVAGLQAPYSSHASAADCMLDTEHKFGTRGIWLFLGHARAPSAPAKFYEGGASDLSYHVCKQQGARTQCARCGNAFKPW